MKAVRYMTPEQLKHIAAEGDAMDFNRQIAPWVLKSLNNQMKIGVTPLLIHEHIGGRKVEPHLRTLVGFKLTDGTVGAAYIDMKFETFHSVPRAEDAKPVLRREIVAPEFANN
jgi:hypothetical protein